MLHFKPNLIEFAISIIFLPYALLIIFAIIFSIICFVYNGYINLSLIPWQVYLAVGVISALVIVIYVTIYCCFKSNIYFDNSIIRCVDKNTTSWVIEKSQIDKIEYVHRSPLLCLFYDDYGLITVYCNKEGNFIKKKFKVFRRTKKLIEKKLGINIINLKKA